MRNYLDPCAGAIERLQQIRTDYNEAQGRIMDIKSAAAARGSEIAPADASVIADLSQVHWTDADEQRLQQLIAKQAEDQAANWARVNNSLVQGRIREQFEQAIIKEWHAIQGERTEQL
jgi:Rps23 Pro-64 3,4-dihydroxylase Tpa1-like proline 4-hydroxylase